MIEGSNASIGGSEKLQALMLQVWRGAIIVYILQVLSYPEYSLQIWVATIKSHSIGKMSLQIKSCRGSVTILGMPLFELVGQLDQFFGCLCFVNRKHTFKNNVGCIFCPVMAVLQSSVSLFCNFAIKKSSSKELMLGVKSQGSSIQTDANQKHELL